MTLAAPNVALLGPAGVGKTRAVATLAEAGIEVFYLDLENGLESVLGYWADKGKPIPDNFHWHKIAPPKRSFKELADMALKVNTLDDKTLANYSDPNRHKYNLFIKVLEASSNFVCHRTGEEFGAVDQWPTSRAFVVDGLTGLGRAAMSLVIGGNPARSQRDWGVAQQQLETYIQMLCDQCPCWFVLCSHIERELDSLGVLKLTVSTLGKALAPKIPALFSDVIYCVRDGTTWTWDTSNSLVDVKTRNLPWKAGQVPDFRPIVEGWKRRAAAATADTAEAKP